MYRLTAWIPTLALIALAGSLAPAAQAGGTCTAGVNATPVSNSGKQLPNLVATAQAAGTFTTLLAAAEAAGLVETLSGPGPLTVFAPTDEAFAKLPAGTVEALLKDKAKLASILTYHVVVGAMPAEKVLKQTALTSVQGGDLLVKSTETGAMIGNAKITATDITASNGVIHVIDTVLMPPADDIVITAINNPKFSTVVAAIKAAGLVETLQGPGPFTVFAPTDAAFAKLPTGTVDGLLQDIPALTNILTFHVISGKYYAGDLQDGFSTATVQGSNVTFDLSGATPMVSGSQIVITDIQCSNGVIHVIDSVLLP
jgi:uncharacterized surface protein with fasciclin (FAS1) repeats